MGGRCGVARAGALVLFLLLPALALATPGPSDPGASPSPERDETIETLRQAVAELGARLSELQQRLADLEATRAAEKKEAEIEALRQAAAARSGTTAEKPGAGSAAVDTSEVFTSGARMQPQLNPEISVTGDLLAISQSSDRERFSNREWEIDFRSYLDPYSKMNITVSFPEDETVEIEEAYIDWFHLPGSLAVALGRQRQQFGVLNRWHQHALDQLDYPLVLEESFGEEGLKGTGLFVTWVTPRLWADSNELVVQVSNGDNDVAFAGGDYGRLTYLTRLKSYWDLTSDSYLEIGVNALDGPAPGSPGLRHDLYALDWAYDWNPAARARYREFTLRGMLLRSELERPGAAQRNAWGGYVYGQYKFTSQLIAGLRYDRVADQRTAGRYVWAVSPYLTFWESEWVRLRGQFTYRDDDLLGIDRKLALQATFAAGPHKHERY